MGRPTLLVRADPLRPSHILNVEVTLLRVPRHDRRLLLLLHLDRWQDNIWKRFPILVLCAIVSRPLPILRLATVAVGSAKVVGSGAAFTSRLRRHLYQLSLINDRWDDFDRGGLREAILRHCLGVLTALPSLYRLSLQLLIVILDGQGCRQQLLVRVHGLSCSSERRCNWRATFRCFSEAPKFTLADLVGEVLVNEFEILPYLCTHFGEVSLQVVGTCEFLLFLLLYLSSLLLLDLLHLRFDLRDEVSRRR